jgi:site-specific DNA-cytosine methylase
MKVVSLFSGIGGLDHGLEQAGHEVILQVEKDPHCLQVLQRHFPGREIRRDVAELTELPAEAELLAAGFPCEVRIFPFFLQTNLSLRM